MNTIELFLLLFIIHGKVGGGEVSDVGGCLLWKVPKNTHIKVEASGGVTLQLSITS